MNKYKNFSIAAQNQRKMNKMCLNKVKFKTEEEAFQNNQRFYKCPYCKFFHRSAQLQKLIFKLTR